MLHQHTENRTFKNNMLLAASTATTAGMVNVAGMMACYSFTANVTGHTALFAKHLLNGNWFELLTAFTWLFMFFFGAFTANFLIHSFQHKGNFVAHSIPLIVEIIIICMVGVYGNLNINETTLQTELIAAALLFSMGLQNSTVSTISGGSIKTSHLTGVFTDLGTELSEWLHPKKEKTQALKSKLQLRLSIVIAYIISGMIGGWLFIQVSFTSFYFIASFLLLLLMYDVLKSYKKSTPVVV